MRNLFAGFGEFVNMHAVLSKKTIGFVSLLILIAAVPLTVFVSQQRQDLQQHATGNYNPAVNGFIWRSLILSDAHNSLYQRCVIANGIVDWNSCPTWGAYDDDGLRGISGERYRGVDGFVLGDKMWQSVITQDGRTSFYHLCPIDSSGTIVWAQCDGWRGVDLSRIRGVGNESYAAVTQEIIGTNLWQSLLDMNGVDTYSQKCPIRQNQIKFDECTGWARYNLLNEGIGPTKFASMNVFVYGDMLDQWFLDTDSVSWSRQCHIVNGNPDWNTCNGYGRYGPETIRGNGNDRLLGIDTFFIQVPLPVPATAALIGPTTATPNELVSYAANITTDGTPSSNIWVTKETGATAVPVTAADVAGFNNANFNCTDGTRSFPNCMWYRIGNGTHGSFTPLTTGTYRIVLDVFPGGTNPNARACTGNPYVGLPTTTGGAQYYDCGANDNVTLVVGAAPTVTPTPTAVPTAGPTSTTAPTATTAPTSTTAPTATLTPNATTFNFTLTLNGIQANKTLQTQTRNIKVELFDQQDVAFGTPKTGTVTYVASSGKFTGTVDMGSLPAGSYTIKVTVDGYLRKRLTGIYTVTNSAQALTIPEPAAPLVAGDITNDNTLDIADYNSLLICFGQTVSNANSGAIPCSRADMNGEGTVDEFDYNVFIRSFSFVTGD